MSLRLNPTNPSRFVASLSAIALAAVGMVACQPQTTTTPTPGTPSAGTTSTPQATGPRVTLSGAGATFPAPLYQNWFTTYNQKVNPNVQVSYQSVGSGAGLEQYINGTVDFGASDAPITGDRLKNFVAKYNTQPIQVPMAAGAVVLAYNLPGVNDLRLSRQAYCSIVEGKITRWNDPAIAAQNPGVNLPDRAITFAHRSDGSGTTFIFVNHVNAACPNWPAGVGTSVNWPAGVGAQGNEGVAAQIQQNEGTIGYIEYAYAKLNDISTALLENRSGNYIKPSAESAAAVFDGVPVPEDFGLVVPDPENPQAFPIAGLTWIMVYPQYQDAAKWNTLREVLLWSLTEGRGTAEQLGYIPMPNSVVERVRNVLETRVSVQN